LTGLTFALPVNKGKRRTVIGDKKHAPNRLQFDDQISAGVGKEQKLRPSSGIWKSDVRSLETHAVWKFVAY